MKQIKETYTTSKRNRQKENDTEG